MHIVPTVSKTSTKTLELLRSRMRERGDLPGFSKVVSAILGAMRGEDDREFNMTKTVLSDPALTQKVLRLANSPMYAVFGGNINTVSKAVIVLGTESIGHLALGLKLIDGLSAATAQSLGARTEMGKAVLAGYVARQIASCANTRDAEEAVVCSMLHSLGRMMVAFYLPESWTLVQQRCANGEAADAVERDVLGIELDQIGHAIAQQWGLPASLINSLTHVLPPTGSEPLDHADWLVAVSSMAVQCADALYGHHDDASHEISKIACSYADMLGMECEQLITAVKQAQAIAEEDAVFVRPAKPLVAVSQPATNTGKPEHAAERLANGVIDIRSALNNVSAPQLLTMALEIIYQGLGLSRAIVFLHNDSDAKYVARMGFGDDVQELMPRLFFDDAYQPDVFHAAMANDKMIFVDDAYDRNFSSKLPRWWKKMFTASRSFIVLPLTINRRPAGFIYGDWSADVAPHAMAENEIAPLNELRALVMAAVENRRRLDIGLTRKIL